MNASELQRLLARRGCSFEYHKAGSGHATIVREERKSQLPVKNKELGTGLVRKILRDLGLE
jgi:mRNA interferase HicA